MIHITQNILRMLREEKSPLLIMHQYLNEAVNRGYRGSKKLNFVESSLRKKLGKDEYLISKTQMQNILKQDMAIINEAHQYLLDYNQHPPLTDSPQFHAEALCSLWPEYNEEAYGR